ncbi:MAG TPA: EutN/CcmL family microcompartment protein [Blastocatellia bacterium]|nr:EutN/CcmL family microcompartment protein [Blastocatellia bacterium]
MILGRVVGNVVATQKNDRYEGSRVMIVEPIGLEGERSGAEFLALDSVDSGPGDVVLVVREGWAASTAATGRPQAAIDSAIIGVVDHIDFE